MEIETTDARRLRAALERLERLRLLVEHLQAGRERFH